MNSTQNTELPYISKLEKTDFSISNKSLASNKITQSRNNSREPGKRSRAHSQTHSTNHSPNISNYRKFVQLFTSFQLMGKYFMRYKNRKHIFQYLNFPKIKIGLKN